MAQQSHPLASHNIYFANLPARRGDLVTLDQLAPYKLLRRTLCLSPADRTTVILRTHRVGRRSRKDTGRSMGTERRGNSINLTKIDAAEANIVAAVHLHLN